MHKVKIGLVGSGFAASLHMEAYKMVYGVEPVLCALASTSEKAKNFADRYGIQTVYASLDEMLQKEKLDVVDICTPPSAHAAQIEKVMMSGCHVICEKTLTGWFGSHDEPNMLEYVEKQLEEIERVIRASGKKFFYAENFVYAPAVQKSAELIEATGAKVLYMKGEESHSGSHAPHAALWSKTGGGSLIRQGCHPLSAVLYLKNKEKKRAGKVTAVVADMGYIVPTLTESEAQNLSAHPVDVEDMANVILTFEDNTKAMITSGDMILGGVRNEVQVYTTSGVYQCHIAPNDQMQVYHIDDLQLDNVYFTEKVETKKGWQSIFLDEDIARGYVGELRDFLLCSCGEKEEPESGFELAKETTRIIYGAYKSAREERKVKM